MKLRRLSTRSRSFEAGFAALTRSESAGHAAWRASCARSSPTCAGAERRGAQIRQAVDGALPREIQVSGSSCAPFRGARPCAAQRREPYPKIPPAPAFPVVDLRGSRRHAARAAGHAARPRRLYLPGGKAAYPSSVLMNAIPAKVAGCAELVMVCPNPIPWCSRRRAGGRRPRDLDRRAQAVAALADGTKRLTRGQDRRPRQRLRRRGQAPGVRPGRHRMIAGPSEILVIGDGSTPPPGWRWTFRAGRTRPAARHPLSPNKGYLDASPEH